jgi:hypothetical protein
VQQVSSPDRRGARPGAEPSMVVSEATGRQRHSDRRQPSWCSEDRSATIHPTANPGP